MNNNLRLPGDDSAHSMSDENREERKVNVRENESLSYLDILDENNSNHTIMSDIPVEEEIVFCSENMGKRKELTSKHNRTMLLINCIQWCKDSHGLFDYDMRDIKNNFYKIKTSKDVIRKETELLFKDPGIDVEKELSEKHQKIISIKKVRNKYIIEGVLPERKDQDIDDHYQEGGDPLLPPFKMMERMYNVVKYQRINNEQVEFLLRKNDIIKMGRVKLKVKNIVNIERNKLKEKMKQRRKKRLQNYVERRQKQAREERKADD